MKTMFFSVSCLFEAIDNLTVVLKFHKLNGEELKRMKWDKNRYDPDSYLNVMSIFFIHQFCSAEMKINDKCTKRTRNDSTQTIFPFYSNEEHKPFDTTEPYRHCLIAPNLNIAGNFICIIQVGLIKWSSIEPIYHLDFYPLLR